MPKAAKFNLRAKERAAILLNDGNGRLTVIQELPGHHDKALRSAIAAARKVLDAIEQADDQGQPQ